MHWKELEKQISKFPEDPNYFQIISQLKWDKAEQISRNIAICCDFLDKSQGSQIDKQKLEEVWLETVEPLADCVEDVFLERHGMLRAIDKKEYGVECAGEAIQQMYDALTSLTRLTHASMLLHLRFPKLFVMTDEAIRKYWIEEVGLNELFGIKEDELFNGYGYTFIFLPFIKDQAVDAIMTYANDKGISPNEAIAQLQNLGGKKRMIARLMNEYYYVISR
jgi:hypothetical protein